MLLAEEVLVRSNTVRDCFATGIYIDNARHVRVEANTLVFTDARFFRRYDIDDHPEINNVPSLAPPLVVHANVRDSVSVV